MERTVEIKDIISESIKIKNLILNDKETLSAIDEVISVLLEAIKSKNKLILAGNGGSAADAQHTAAEFVSRFYIDRPGIPAIALTTDTSIITSIGNDYDFSKIFSRQLESIGSHGDVLIAISTSGNSPNIINALEEAKKMGIITVGLTGFDGGKMIKFCDYCICIPSKDTPRIQESHIVIEHILCAVIEKELFEK